MINYYFRMWQHKLMRNLYTLELIWSTHFGIKIPLDLHDVTETMRSLCILKLILSTHFGIKISLDSIRCDILFYFIFLLSSSTLLRSIISSSSIINCLVYYYLASFSIINKDDLMKFLFDVKEKDNYEIYK